MDKGVTEEKNKRIKNRVNFSGLYVLALIFILFMAALLAVQKSVIYTMRAESLDLLPKEQLMMLKNEEASNGRKKNDGVTDSGADKGCLVIYETDDEISENALEEFEPILKQIDEVYTTCPSDKLDGYSFDDYKNVVIACTHYQLMENNLVTLRNWVKNGGNLLILYPPELTGSFEVMYDIVGIQGSGGTSVVDGLHFVKDFMLGGTQRDYGITDAYESSLGVALKEDCEVYLQSVDEYPIPLIWRRKVDKGTVVFDNFGSMEKSYRGIHCAAYSLLGDYCVYPVINGSVFYIDDFPSPIPEGNGEYVYRDYQLSIEDFYSQVWWNDVYGLGTKYSFPYTAVTIEDYSDQVEGEFLRNKQTNRFLYFGNMVLSEGGEIGVHGYNHMPLVPESFDYESKFDEYIQWPSKEDMKNSLDEVFAFNKSLFPEEESMVYVPPSNILSEEGREVLAESTTTRTIASIYIPGDLAYDQEFDISGKDGIINTPRVISGYVIDDYMKLLALSELNFHLVSSHFQHPDDALDEDRGAELGWKKLFGNYSDYVDWLYKSCPDIRRLTGSEIAAAVQRYDLTGVNRSYKDGVITLNLDNFDKEAWMLLRLNEGQEIDSIEGGSYTKAASDLFIIECNEKTVNIKLR